MLLEMVLHNDDIPSAASHNFKRPKILILLLLKNKNSNVIIIVL